MGYFLKKQTTHLVMLLVVLACITGCSTRQSNSVLTDEYMTYRHARYTETDRRELIFKTLNYAAPDCGDDCLEALSNLDGEWALEVFKSENQPLDRMSAAAAILSHLITESTEAETSPFLVFSEFGYMEHGMYESAARPFVEAFTKQLPLNPMLPDYPDRLVESYGAEYTNRKMKRSLKNGIQKGLKDADRVHTALPYLTSYIHHFGNEKLYWKYWNESDTLRTRLALAAGEAKPNNELTQFITDRLLDDLYEGRLWQEAEHSIYRPEGLDTIVITRYSDFLRRKNEEPEVRAAIYWLLRRSERKSRSFRAQLRLWKLAESASDDDPAGSVVTALKRNDREPSDDFKKALEAALE